MKTKQSTTLALAVALLLSANYVAASGNHGDHGKPIAKPAASTAAPTAVPTTTAADTDMTDAEVRKVDADNQKITLKHGFIKNLDMPGMTMVFTAKEKAQLTGLTAGDKVKFTVEMVEGKFTVTNIKKVAP